MKGITARVIQVARNGGLEAQMLQDKETKDFIDFSHQINGGAPSKPANPNRSPRELQNQMENQSLRFAEPV